ncbi:M20 family metallo-hydrolase [Domibacillus mangrovi]|uniref:Allantoate amidohydrolase n=1 Tax=Domibacillus mangrovi TaxID=1714354 RepID=A0A1Q5NZD5_9BACI|nr:M20 family metallo-hydrolase [Domibacillus mangrovi]OKL35283.1 allantoate amidohydrolase [Domibacillus mangrovi]
MANTQFYKRLLENYDHQQLNRNGVCGERLAKRLAEMAEIGWTEDGGSHRIGFSQEEKEAKQLVMQWMKEAGLDVTLDGAGNVYGRMEGQNEQMPALMSGSHVDTVPNGGHFDGVLGVLVALEVVESWKEQKYAPEAPYEVVIFTDEEGSRFHDGFTGSRAAFGTIDESTQRKVTDYEGEPFELVLNKVGLSSNQFFSAKRDLKEIEAYFEVHIEQGVILENADLPVGVVSGIAGPCWLEMKFMGVAGHAGNTPMDNRQDALVAAGELVSQIPTLPRKVSPTAVATVGKLEVKPNGINVIPGEVTMYVDIRDINGLARDELIQLVLDEATSISQKYGINYEWNQLLKNEPVPFKADMIQKIKTSVEENGIRPLLLPSGAGHDAMILGSHVPTGMIFVRSKDGLSHNPLEWSSLNDCVQSVHVLKHMLENYWSE